MDRIGLVIVTYQRFDRFKECFDSVLKNRRDIEEIVIVDDCSVTDKELYDEYFKNLIFNDIIVMRNPVNSGVAVTKNKGLKYFYDKGYDYIFTLEDDINILSPEVFRLYINASKMTDYHYFNFALHGPLNKGKGQDRVLCGIPVTIYPHIVGAFSLHTRKLIDELGFYDEKFFNAWEHVDYCYQASLKGLTTPFWSFIDLKDSDKYLQEQKFAIDDSSIRPREDWMINIGKGAQYFYEKNKVSISDIPRT
jgi:GT2 family glycosyltransferase